MTAEPKIEHHSELEALTALAGELARIAKQANDTVKQLPPHAPEPGPGLRDFVLSTDAGAAAISTALRYQEAGKPPQFMYLGEVGIKPTIDETLKSFKPVYSFELFELGGNRSVAAGAAAIITNAAAEGDHPAVQSHASVCLSNLTFIIVRASLLALTIQYLIRSYPLQLLPKLLEGDATDYTAWRNDFAAAHTKLRNALEAAYPNSGGAAPSLPNGVLVSTSFELSPGQRTINGVYFPKEHEDFVMNKLAAMQAEALSRRP
jgi:hypothetical protein